MSTTVMKHDVAGGDSQGNDPEPTVILEAAPSGFTISSGGGGGGVEGDRVVVVDGSSESEPTPTTVSIHCSSLGEDGEMLINTIEVSTEELMTMGQPASEEIEFIYSPNIQFQLGSLSTEEAVVGGGICGIEVMEPVQITLSDFDPGETEISLPQEEDGPEPRLVVNQEKDQVNEDAISKAILQAATNILHDNNRKRVARLKNRKERVSPGSALESPSSSIDTNFVITSVQGASPIPTTPRGPSSKPIDDVVFTTIDGKRLKLQPGSQLIPVSQSSQSKTAHIGGETAATTGELPNVIYSTDLQTIDIETQLPSIVEAAAVAQQTVTAALNSQNVASLLINTCENGAASNNNNRFQNKSATTIQVEVPGGTPLQLQKYYCQPSLCRVCLLVKENLTSIFEDITVDSHGMVENARGPNASHKFNILAALKTLLDVDVEYNDGLPDTICTDCYDQLMNFSVYRKRIAIGQAKLTQILNQVKDSSAPTFIPHLGEVDMQKTDIYRYPSSIVTANNVLSNSQYSHLVLRKISDRVWDKIFSAMATIVGYKSGKLKNLEMYACEMPYVSGFFCYTCNSTVHGKKEDYAAHYNEFHGVKSKEDVLFPCDICGNGYPLKDTSAVSQSYAEHWIQHFFLHECTFCSRKLPSAKGLWVHKKSAHGSREKIFACDEENCTKSFFKKTHLDNHKRTHLDLSSRSEHLTFCHLCGKGLSSSLTAHINTVHGSERPWRCDICQKQFKRKEILLGHRESVHLHTKKYNCDICGESFKSQSAKSVHVLRHKGDKRYSCTLCSKKFFSSHALKSHTLKHQVGGDFPCSECGKIFKRAAYLEEHKRTHTGEKPFKCPICSKAIRMKSNYFKHLRIHKRKNEIS